MYRWPKQTDKFNKIFYQFRYINLASENMHLPSPQEARLLLDDGFRNHATHLGDKVRVVKMIQPTGRLCVYGANWGYEVAQLAAGGYGASGFELSEPRAHFAREHLNLDVLSNLDVVEQEGPYDLVYCSHTMEHLPDPRPTLEYFRRVCRPGGHLIIFVPNCGGDSAKRLGVHWGPFSSSLHPLSYQSKFFQRALPEHGFEFLEAASDPYRFDSNGKLASSDLSGDELLIIARRRES